MKTDKTKLLQDIEAMKEKLASMEKELNKPEVFKHFPSQFDKYYCYTPSGNICNIIAANDSIKPYTYKTKEEAHEAYNKAVAIEKIKRRILELQGDWKPNWKDVDEVKLDICYYHHSDIFEANEVWLTQCFKEIPYIKNQDIVQTIINEMENELKLIFDIT